MSTKFFLFALVAFVLCATLEAGRLNPGLSLTNEKEQNCVCKPWSSCQGTVNSDVQCHPSYIMICCVETLDGRIEKGYSNLLGM